MKQKFSTSWKSSKQPRKQRKYRANAPLHIMRKFLSSNLSKELRTKHQTRNITIRKGDMVKIMRGNFKAKTGKISSVNIKRQRVSVENIQRQKKDGTKVNVWFNPSNLQIIELNLDDKKRIDSFKQEVKNKPEKK